MVHRLAVHDEVSHTEVHVWRQPAIEFDLAVAVRSAVGAMPEVQKVELNGLADLVDLVSGENEDRDVGLRQPYCWICPICCFHKLISPRILGGAGRPVSNIGIVHLSRSGLDSAVLAGPCGQLTIR